MHLAVMASGALPPRCLTFLSRARSGATGAARFALAVLASGAGAGSAATEPRSPTPSALGAVRRSLASHGRNGAQRSGGPQRGWRSENV